MNAPKPRPRTILTGDGELQEIDGDCSASLGHNLRRYSVPIAVQRTRTTVVFAVPADNRLMSRWLTQQTWKSIPHDKNVNAMACSWKMCHRRNRRHRS